MRAIVCDTCGEKFPEFPAPQHPLQPTRHPIEVKVGPVIYDFCDYGCAIARLVTLSKPAVKPIYYPAGTR